MVVRVTVQNTQNEAIYAFELDEEAIVEDIKVFICAESDIDIEEQILMCNGKILGDNYAKIKNVGVTQDALILLTTKTALQGAQNMRSQQ